LFWPLHGPPFPHLRRLFGTARSSQGRAGFARRSEPLTARTVPESGAGGKGGRGSQGVSPWRGSGAAPRAPYRAPFARHPGTPPPPSAFLRRPTGGARSPACVAAFLRPGFHPHSDRPVPRPGARWGSSEGGGLPSRCRARPPGFPGMPALPRARSHPRSVSGYDLPNPSCPQAATAVLFEFLNGS